MVSSLPDSAACGIPPTPALHHSKLLLLSVVLLLEKRHYPQNSPIVFCPNKEFFWKSVVFVFVSVVFGSHFISICFISFSAQCSTCPDVLTVSSYLCMKKLGGVTTHRHIRLRRPWQARFYKWFVMFYFCNTQAISTRTLVVKTITYRHLQWGYSSWRLLHPVSKYLYRSMTVASSAASAILNLSDRRADAV